MSSRTPRLSGPARLDPARADRGLGRALALLLAVFGLTACVAQQGAPGYGRPAVVAGQPATLQGRRVAMLLPLTGANARLGTSMLLAAKLAFPSPGTTFDTLDTKSTSDGAVTAANAAAASGAGLFVGPLTASETTALAPVARARGILVLALTSDSSKAQPGIWPMGLTPAQQVRTLVRASLLDGKRRIAAILPATPFGDALAAGLVAATAEAGLSPSTIARYRTTGDLNAAVKRLGSADAPGAAPPLDSLLLGTPADTTLQILPALVAAGLGPDRVRILGTAIWGRDATRLAPLAGAWFAGPPAATLKVFEDTYIGRYGTPPRDVASIAFDAAGAAHAAMSPAGIDVSTLVNSSGFAGANGVFRLLPDGTVRRTLALFEIGSSGVKVRDIPPEAPIAPSM